MAQTAFFVDFVDGFIDAAPASYDYRADMDTPRPWCCPWYWADAKEWLQPDLSPYDMGKAWALHVYEELQAVLEEEEKR